MKFVALRMIFVLLGLLVTGQLYAEAKAFQKTPLDEWDVYRGAFQLDIFREPRIETQSVNKGGEIVVSLDQNLGIEADEMMQSLQDMVSLPPPEECIDIDWALYDITITGVGFVSGRPKIFFENRATGKSYYLAQGQEEDGIRVEQIRRLAIIFRIQGQKLKIDRQF